MSNINDLKVSHLASKRVKKDNSTLYTFNEQGLPFEVNVGDQVVYQGNTLDELLEQYKELVRRDKLLTNRLKKHGYKDVNDFLVSDYKITPKKAVEHEKRVTDLIKKGLI